MPRSQFEELFIAAVLVIEVVPISVQDHARLQAPHAGQSPAIRTCTRILKLWRLPQEPASPTIAVCPDRRIRHLSKPE